MQHTIESAQGEHKEIVTLGDINIQSGVACIDQLQAVVNSLQLTHVIISPIRVTVIGHMYTTRPQHVRSNQVDSQQGLSASDHDDITFKQHYADNASSSVSHIDHPKQSIKTILCSKLFFKLFGHTCSIIMIMKMIWMHATDSTI